MTGSNIDDWFAGIFHRVNRSTFLRSAATLLCHTNEALPTSSLSHQREQEEEETSFSQMKRQLDDDSGSSAVLINHELTNFIHSFSELNVNHHQHHHLVVPIVIRE